MAAPLSVTVPHQLTQAEARARVEKLMADVGNQVPGATGMATEWDGDRLSFQTTVMGQKIEGSADVKADHIKLDLLLPGMLGMMAGQIKAKLEQRAGALLGPPSA